MCKCARSWRWASRWDTVESCRFARHLVAQTQGQGQNKAMGTFLNGFCCAWECCPGRSLMPAHRHPLHLLALCAGEEPVR